MSEAPAVGAVHCVRKGEDRRPGLWRRTRCGRGVSMWHCASRSG